MGAIKKKLRGASLKRAFILYFVVCLLIAVVLSAASSGLCQLGQSLLYKKYQAQYHAEIGQQGQVFLEDGSLDGKLQIYTRDIRSFYTDFEKGLDRALDILSIALVPVWFAVCIGATGALFYRRKLQTPLAILDAAADNIAENNLDFTVSYDKSDEMGRLCRSFEKMRAALQENHLEMWRQLEERKRLNAAFSHDLRTPLTVLKGQTEMLLKYIPDGRMPTQKVVSAVGAMKAHVDRLESYVATMSSLQKLEDIAVDKQQVTLEEVKERIADSCGPLCQGKELVLETAGSQGDTLSLDLQVVLQVAENLVANAARYACSRVAVRLESAQCFSITVADDGPGFGKEAMEKATAPFYRAENTPGGQHFGMGLHICRVLCEKHGGFLRLSNGGGDGGDGAGGAVVRAVF